MGGGSGLGGSGWGVSCGWERRIEAFVKIQKKFFFFFFFFFWGGGGLGRVRLGRGGGGGGIGLGGQGGCEEK